jgi:phosphoesterase RecJ-like protein
VKEQINQMIEAANTIIIHRHERPDPDALGSQFGLQLTFQHQFPEKTVLSPGEMATSLTFMGKLDRVEYELYKEALVVILDTANQARIEGKIAMTGKDVI